ncbi:hypothetical protein ABT297_03985 [Dactylosporangium sp. NPDC000555]|uniref:hypothetical protein n=1 Tax=Dactylosporangium sp. NPDC000555 TaxID=3154260 RepID=UPI0033261713
MSSRIKIYAYDEIGGKTLDGWFDADKAELTEEDTRWNGNNHVSVHTTDQYEHQGLYRTSGGRWVLNTWSQRQGVEPRYEFLTGEQAREWLLANDSDDVIGKHFGEVEEERGPGRPGVGNAVHVRLGDLLPRVDAVAKERGKSRADTVRDLVAQALGER